LYKYKPYIQREKRYIFEELDVLLGVDRVLDLGFVAELLLFFYDLWKRMSERGGS